MIPVMMRFWMPHGGGVTPPPEEYECADPVLIATFDTAGTIDGDSLELSPVSGWTYASASASASGGSVSPANFSASGGNHAELYSAYLAGNRASGETLRFEFSTLDGNTKIAIELADGTNGCTVEHIKADLYGTPPDPETVSATFTLAAGEFAVYFRLRYQSEILVYIAPDFVNEEVILNSVRYSFPTYLQCRSFEVTCSGSSSTVNYIRMCGFGDT